MAVACVDLEKAYDKICREKLWCVLGEHGVKGNLMKAIRSLYAKESSMCYSWWKAVRVVLNQAGSEAGLCVIAMVVQCIHG